MLNVRVKNSKKIKNAEIINDKVFISKLPTDTSHHIIGFDAPKMLVTRKRWFS